jgi:hypothetical protein
VKLRIVLHDYRSLNAVHYVTSGDQIACHLVVTVLRGSDISGGNELLYGLERLAHLKSGKTCGSLTHNAAVQRRRADRWSAAHAHNEMTRVRRAAIPFAPSATAC